jgi:hypothetical protein
MKHLSLAWLLLLPGLSLADNPFVAQWVMRPELTTFSQRTMDLLIERNTFRQTGCGDPLEVPTDGADQPINGQPLFDSMAVRLMDRGKVEVVQKMGGKLAWRGIYTVSKDQRHMTLVFEDDRVSNPVTGTIRYARVGEPLSGAHSLSGSWRAEKMLQLSPNALTLRIETVDQGLGLHWSDGRSVESNLDTKYYPLHGYLQGAGVSVLHDRPDTLALNRVQSSIPVEVSRIVLSEDAKSVSYAQVDWVCRTAMYFTYQRQAEIAPRP